MIVRVPCSWLAGARALFVALAVVSAAGCDGGFSDEEAAARCDQEREARECMTDAAYDECVAAYVECGEDVVIAGTCPTTFSCASVSEDPAAEE